MIARLYAMYHGSKKIFVFLIAVFPTITAACGVLFVLAIRTLPWGMLRLSRKTSNHQADTTNFR